MSPTGSRHRFVGREAELDRLTGCLERAASGDPRAVLIGGDAGVGKSRLVEELCRRVAGDQVITAMGGCVPVEGGLPFGPLVGILRDLDRQLGVPAIADLLTILTTGASHPAALGGERNARHSTVDLVADRLARMRLFDAVTTAVTELAADTPVILVFEDLHWADSASTDLLSFMIRTLYDAKVLLIGTHRSDDVNYGHPLRPWISEFIRHERVEQLAVLGLDRAGTAELITAVLGHPADVDVLDTVWARAEGNPFFTEELAQSPATGPLPDRLRDVVRTRLDDMSAPLQQVLDVVGVAGGPLHHDVLTAVAGVDGDQLHEVLTEAVARRVLVADGVSSTYQFRHALMQEVVYNAVLPAERRRLHYAIAKVLADTPPTAGVAPSHHAAALAAHWAAAQEWDKAFGPSLAAADAADALLAFPETLRHLERALLALERAPTQVPLAGSRRAELLDRAATAAQLCGLQTRAAELRREAVASIDATVDPAAAAAAYLRLCRDEWSAGDVAAATSAVAHARELLPDNQRSAMLARVLAFEAVQAIRLGVDAAMRICRDAIAMAEGVNAYAEMAHALSTLGICLGGRASFDEVIGVLRESVAMAERGDSFYDLSRCYTNLSHALAEAGRLTEAVEMLDEVTDGEHPWGFTFHMATGNTVEALVRMGRLDDAEALLAQLRAEDPIGVCESTSVAVPLHIAIERGQYVEGHRLLDILRQISVRLPDPQVSGDALWLEAMLAIGEDRPDDALGAAERGIEVTAAAGDESIRPALHTAAVRAMADQADHVSSEDAAFDLAAARLRAAEHVSAAEALAAAPVERGGECSPRVVAFASQARAEFSRLERSDPDLWAAAVRDWDLAGEPYFAAYCRWREAEVLLEQRSGRERAAGVLAVARAAADRVGASPLVSQIDDLARRARLSITPSTEAPAKHAVLARDRGLTPRELEVLACLTAGYTDREIAASLFISKKTASVHVSNLLRKLDVGSRIEAGKIGRANGVSAPVAS